MLLSGGLHDHRALGQSRRRAKLIREVEEENRPDCLPSSCPKLKTESHPSRQGQQDCRSTAWNCCMAFMAPGMARDKRPGKASAGIENAEAFSGARKTRAGALRQNGICVPCIKRCARQEFLAGALFWIPTEIVNVNISSPHKPSSHHSPQPPPC